MTWLLAGLAIAQTAPCDDPPPEVVKCTAETKADANRTVDLASLLGSPTPPNPQPACQRTTVTVVTGSPLGVTDRLAELDDAFERCATEAQARTPKLIGTARFTLTIDAMGRVRDVGTARSTLNDKALPDCLEETLTTAKFTASPRLVRLEVACTPPRS
ncbi:MAG: AgmX/PglI C-terminal domain-containing protein [Myxococcota bacterium]